MHEQLRELAKSLREKHAALEAEKQVKIAQMVNAAVGLNFLRSKLGR